MAATFINATHIEEFKNTRKYQIERMPAPPKVIIPMQQHIGIPCEPLVKVGDIVDKGQKIGDVNAGLGCPVHASVSGTVSAIIDVTIPNGKIVKGIVIDNDYEDRLSPEINPFNKKLNDATFEEIVSIIREAGIVGMGGAMFPSYAKVTSAVGKVDNLFINCAECEPFITANHRLLLENPAAVINGIKILLKALGLRQAVIAIEDNKLDAVNKLEDLIQDSELIKVKVLKTRYPQGDEKQIIYALTGKEVPVGKLPIDIGCVVFNPETCSAIFNAFLNGMPLLERIVTVDGDSVKTPKNVLVPIGTSYKDLFEFCGGFKKQPAKIINGGPMMGIAQWDMETAVNKGTTAILAFSKKAIREYEQKPVCIRCGKCVGVCPARLMPLYLALYTMIDKIDVCKSYDIFSCVECGLCSYVCPGKLPILQYIRTAKVKLCDDIAKAKPVSACELSDVNNDFNEEVIPDDGKVDEFVQETKE